MCDAAGQKCNSGQDKQGAHGLLDAAEKAEFTVSESLVKMGTASQKLGILCGPAISGVLADMFGLRSIFLLNSGTKLIALAIFITYIAETRPDDTLADDLGLLLARLMDEAGPDLLLAPQGVGGHVDHVQLVRALTALAPACPVLWRS